MKIKYIEDPFITHDEIYIPPLLCREMAVCKPLESWRDFIVAMGNAAYKKGVSYSVATKVINYGLFAQTWFDNDSDKKPLDKNSPETKKLWETMNWIYSDAQSDTEAFADISIDALKKVVGEYRLARHMGDWAKTYSRLLPNSSIGDLNCITPKLFFTRPVRPIAKDAKNGCECIIYSDDTRQILDPKGSQWVVYGLETETGRWIAPLEALWNTYNMFFLKELAKRTKQAFRNAS